MSSNSAGFQFYQTPRVRFGAGAFATLADEAAASEPATDAASDPAPEPEAEATAPEAASAE